MKASQELLFKYLIRLENKEALSKTELNYNLAKNYPETERTRVLRSALLKKLIIEKPDLSTNRVGRSVTFYSITEKGRVLLTEYMDEQRKKEGDHHE